VISYLKNFSSQNHRDKHKQKHRHTQAILKSKSLGSTKLILGVCLSFCLCLSLWFCDETFFRYEIQMLKCINLYYLLPCVCSSVMERLLTYSALEKWMYVPFLLSILIQTAYLSSFHLHFGRHYGCRWTI